MLPKYRPPPYIGLVFVLTTVVLPVGSCGQFSDNGYPLRRGRLKCDGTREETRFCLSAKRTSPFKSAGDVSSVDYWPAEVCASAVVMLDTPCSEVV